MEELRATRDPQLAAMYEGRWEDFGTVLMRFSNGAGSPYFADRTSARSSDPSRLMSCPSSQ